MSVFEPPSLPPHDASPMIVRTYLAQVLQEQHHITKEEAEDIAANWKYGRGSELTYYDVETFRAMFGGEAGCLLFGYARHELRTSRTALSDQFGREDVVRQDRVDVFGMAPGCKFLILPPVRLDFCVIPHNRI